MSIPAPFTRDSHPAVHRPLGSLTGLLLALWLAVGFTATVRAQSGLSRYANFSSALLLRVNNTIVYSYSGGTITRVTFGTNYLVSSTNILSGISVGGWCLSANGDILVADNVNHVIRRITPAGGNTIIAGVAGGAGTQDGAATGGGALNAQFRGPAGIVELPANAPAYPGQILIADTGNNMLRIFDPTTVQVSVIGGLPVGGAPSASSRFDGALYLTPGDVATPGDALFAAPKQLFRLNDGRIFMVEGNGVRQIDALLTTVSVIPNFPVLNAPYFTVETPNALLVAELGAHTVSRLFLANPQTPTLLAGLPGAAGGRQGDVSIATLNSPTGVVPGPVGFFVIADQGNGQLRRLGSLLGNGPTILAGLSNAVYEVGNSHTWRTLATGATGAGTPLFYSYSRNGAGVAGGSDLTNVVVSTDLKRSDDGDWAATVYDDFGQTDIPSAQLAITITDPLWDFTTVASSSQFSGPVDAFWLAPDGDSLYFSQTSDHTIQMLQISTGAKIKIAGVANFPGATDGAGNQARFNAPQAVWGDGTNTLYVADTGNHFIRRINLATRFVSTFSGTASAGAGYRDDVAGFAQFETPARLTVGPDGKLYVLDGVSRLFAVFGGHDSQPFSTRIRILNAFGTASTLLSSELDQFDFAPGLKPVFFRMSVEKILVEGGLQQAGGGGGNAEGTLANARFAGSGYTQFDYPGTGDGPKPGDGPKVLYDPFTGVDNFLVVDTYNHCLRRLRATNLVTTLAGQPGVSGLANGPGTDRLGNSSVRFNTPKWAQFDTNGNLFVLDGPQTIRRGVRVNRLVITTQSQSQNLATGNPLNLSVTAAGPGPITYQWIRNGSYLTGENGPTLSLPVAQPGNYTVLLRSSHGTVLSLPAVVSVFDPPLITRQPISGTVDPGDPIAVNVIAGGAAPLSYQWYKDGVALPGETNDLYVVLSAGVTSQGLYHAVVSNPVGSVASTAAQILVALPVSILQQPVGGTRSVSEGLNATLAVTNLGGLPPFFFQWFKDGQAITSFTTNAAFALTNAALADAGNYFVVITNSITNALGGGNVVTSDVITVSILPKPRIVQQPTSLATAFDQTFAVVTFGVVATGEPPLSYQWEKNLIPIPGATNAILNPPNLLANAGTYRVRVSNVQGITLSSNAQFTVLPSSVPSIVSQPVAQVALTGATVTLAVTAAGAPPPSYQWIRAGVALLGETNTTLTVANVTPGSAADYYVQVFNDRGLVNSTPATLTVHAPPVLITPPQSLTVTQGTTTNFSASISGTPTPVVTWFKDGVRLTNSSGYSGVSTPNLLVLTAEGAQAGSYLMVATNVAGSITSAPVSLTVLLAPTITTHPTDVTLFRASSNYAALMPVTLSVAATGAAPLFYQWRFNGGDLAGETNTTFTLTNVTRLSNGVYQAVVTNIAGSAASSNALVRVRVAQRVEPPVFTPGAPFRLRFTDDNGEQASAVDLAKIEVQAATNLLGTNTAWVTLTNGFSVVGGMLQLDDSWITNSLRRYYRVIEK